MSEFHTTTHIPVWRLLVYGLLGFAVACGLGYHSRDRGLIIGAAIAVPLVVVLTLTTFRLGRSPAARRHRGTILWLYILSQSALAIWSLLDHYRHP